MTIAHVIRRPLVCALLALGVAASAQAQQAPPSAPLEPARPLIIETTMPAWALMDMPSSGSLYSLLETIHPEVVSNRIEGGGMYPGSAAHLGAHGSTWTQTMFRAGRRAPGFDNSRRSAGHRNCRRAAPCRRRRRSLTCSVMAVVAS